MLKLQYLGDNTTYKVSFSKFGNIVTLKGENLPVSETGFMLSRLGENDDWDYSNYNTLYRQIEDGIQYSNDGSKYIAPTKKITVSLLWEDGNNVLGKRPESVIVIVNKNNTFLETIELNEENNWSYNYDNLAIDDIITIECEIANYNSLISGTTIIASTDYPQPEVITIEDLAEAVAELYELIAEVQ